MKEMEEAAKSLKGKMCTGHDGIPLKILKDSIPAICLPMKRLMELSCAAIPLAWKISIVIPLHKNKSKTSVEN
jgi:hypothetical protein